MQRARERRRTAAADEDRVGGKLAVALPLETHRAKRRAELGGTIRRAVHTMMHAQARDVRQFGPTRIEIKQHSQK